MLTECSILQFSLYVHQIKMLLDVSYIHDGLDCFVTILLLNLNVWAVVQFWHFRGRDENSQVDVWHEVEG